MPKGNYLRQNMMGIRAFQELYLLKNFLKTGCNIWMKLLKSVKIYLSCLILIFPIQLIAILKGYM